MDSDACPCCGLDHADCIEMQVQTRKASERRHTRLGILAVLLMASAVVIEGVKIAVQHHWL